MIAKLERTLSKTSTTYRYKDETQKERKTKTTKTMGAAINNETTITALVLTEA